ncbi:MAG: LysR substrate-binding domain-containing protein [Rhodospirillaceae bacterium]
MRKLKDRLPPANSLIAFEAVARHQSFTKAAAELLVSQAAVSRQIQIAEDSLGVKLFVRHHRKIELTRQGSALFNAASMGLEHIAHTCEEMRMGEERADITVSSSVTFASFWLMSRIAKFRAEQPEVDVRMVASPRVRDLGLSGIDFAVRYGSGNWPNTAADLMFENDIFPVCSPAYLDIHGPFAGVPDLSRATLLKLSQSHRNWTRWHDWFAAFGHQDSPDTRVHRYDNYLLLIQAAIRGEGIALCGRRLADDMIRNGELMRPVDALLKSDYAFYLLRPADDVLTPAKARFRDWLLKEAGAAPAPGD